MFKNKKIIIFDMDGTLIDSVGIWNKVDQALIKALGYFEEISETEIQKQRDAKFKEYSTSTNPYLDYCRFLSVQYKSSLSGEVVLDKRFRLSKKHLESAVKYKESVPDLLKKLIERNFTLAIASTTKKEDMNIYRNHNKNIIASANIDDYFTLIYTREDVKHIKPSPEVHVKIIDELHVSRDECLIFEDSIIGVEAAKNAGIEVAAIYDKYSDDERKEINSLANYTFRNYQEVIQELLRETL